LRTKRRTDRPGRQTSGKTREHLMKKEEKRERLDSLHGEDVLSGNGIELSASRKEKEKRKAFVLWKGAAHRKGVAFG